MIYIASVKLNFAARKERARREGRDNSSEGYKGANDYLLGCSDSLRQGEWSWSGERRVRDEYDQERLFREGSFLVEDPPL